MTLTQLFERISTDDIGRFVADSQEEHLELEFKTVSDASLRHRDDRRNLAIAISGFANASGGLVVWGVEARRNEDGVDCAVATEPIGELTKFLSRLNELGGQATLPVVEGVQHRGLPTGQDKGFAVTLVPESESGPHMAKLGENRYYKRSGDSFYLMEHFDVEDMFGRRKRPRLDLVVRVTGTGKDTQIYLGIHNDGRGTAKAPYLAFTVPAPFSVSPYGIDGNRTEGLPRLVGRSDSPWRRYGSNAMSVIHPDTVLEVAALWLGRGLSGSEPPADGALIEYAISAEDARMIKGNIRVTFD